MHGELYKNQEFESRQRRVSLTLPPPVLNVERNPDDRWARERAAVNHFHPGLVISAAADDALSSMENYELVLAVVKKQPRFSARALKYFYVEEVTADMVQLYSTLEDGEPRSLLAEGIAEGGEESALVGLLALGLDRFKAEARLGREFVLMGRSIARAHAAGPDPQVLQELKDLLSQAPENTIMEFSDQLKKDGRNARLPVASAGQDRAQQRYWQACKKAFGEISPAAEALAGSLFF